MAYSAIEQRYINLLTTAEFPDAIDEPVEQEPSLDGVQLAAGPSATRTDAGPRYGRGGVTKAQSEAAGGFERPLTALADVAAGVARGGVVQAAGLGGDLEMIYNGLKSVFNRPEDQSRIDAFLNGMAVKTGMATSEQVSKEGFRIPLTDIQVKLPPVVPEGAADAKSRQATADVGQAFGELAPLPGAIEAGVAGTKAIAKGTKDLAPIAGQMAEDYMAKTGGLLKAAPDFKVFQEPIQVQPTINSLSGGFDNAITQFTSLDPQTRVSRVQQANQSLAKWLGTNNQTGKTKPLLTTNGKLLKTEKGVEGGEPITLPDGRNVESAEIGRAHV